MNISYNWLKDIIDTDLSVEETANALTRVGLAVEGIHPFEDDFVLDIDLTSNRPDCLSHLGVARELSVIIGKPVVLDGRRREDRLPDAPFPSILAPDIVRIDDPDLCLRFTARVIRNVKIGPSPDWLVKRLESLGERSINNVADITNYVMLELGQPMHAFDLDKLAEHRIVVRRARTGETIKTLDEVERKLDEEMLAICDAERPIAVAGVMGGFDSGITEQTENVVLEVAYFKRENIRRTSRKLGLATQASYRFERGVDIENLKLASDRATALICGLAGGNAGEFIDVYPETQLPRIVASKDVSHAVKRLTGLDVPAFECDRLLNALGISNSDLPTLYSSPTWRHDIAIEEDLVEEVARHFGYENIKEELPPAYGAGEYQATELREKLIRRTLADMGFDEAICYSFIDTRYDDVIEEVPDFVNHENNDRYVTLEDSVIDGAVRMRTTLIPGLLESVRLNFNHQRKDLKLFELGKVFAASDIGELPKEREVLSIILTGGEINEARSMSLRPLDFFDAKGALESVLTAAGVSDPNFVEEEVKHLRNGQTASVIVGEHKVGFIGRLNEEIEANYKFRQPVYVAEIDLQSVLARTPEPVRYTPLPKYPSVIRDVSFILDRSVSFGAIRDLGFSERPDLLQSITFVDLFEGKGLEENERSLTVRFSYQSNERTLTEDEVNAKHSNLVRRLETQLNIRQRN